MQYKMKDSGVEWIGNIPQHWKKCRLKSVLRILRGSSPRPIEEYLTDSGDGINWIKIGDTDKGQKSISQTKQKIKPSGVAKSRLVRKGDLLLTNSMSFGEPYFLEIDGCIHDGWVCFTNLTNINKLFLYYFLCSEFCRIQFQLQVAGGVVQNLNIDKIGETILYLPLAKEQSAIADYLDEKCGAIDEIIEQAKATIEEYKAWKSSVIFEAVTKGLDPNVEMKDSGVEWIGKMPETWELKPFRYFLHERMEKNSPVKSTERLSLSIELGVTLYSEKTTNLDRFKDDFEQYKLAHEGDLVMNSMNMIVGASGVSKYFGCISPAYYTFYDKLPDHASAKYCEYVFRSKAMLRILYSLGRGIYAIERGDDRVNTCRLKVPKEDLKALLLPSPSVKEQREIINYLDRKCSAIDEIIAEKEALIADMDAYKKSLIFESVTGKRKVC